MMTNSQYNGWRFEDVWLDKCPKETQDGGGELLGRGIAGLESPAPAGITEIVRILSPKAVGVREDHRSGGGKVLGRIFLAARRVKDGDYKLQQDLARPIIYHLRAATCGQPEVTGLTPSGEGGM